MLGEKTTEFTPSPELADPLALVAVSCTRWIFELHIVAAGDKAVSHVVDPSRSGTSGFPMLTRKTKLLPAGQVWPSRTYPRAVLEKQASARAKAPRANFTPRRMLRWSGGSCGEASEPNRIIKSLKSRNRTHGPVRGKLSSSSTVTSFLVGPRFSSDVPVKGGYLWDEKNFPGIGILHLAAGSVPGHIDITAIRIERAEDITRFARHDLCRRFLRGLVGHASGRTRR